MPIFYQQDIDDTTRLAIWKIEEEEAFFKVPLQRDITHPHKRLQHLAGRFLLRYLFDDFPVDLIKLADTRKPFLENEAYHFSISHCGNYAAAIVSRTKRVGIDIEVPTPKVEKIVHKFLHQEEMRLVGDQLAACRPGDAISSGQLAAIDGCENVNSQLQTPGYLLTLLWSMKEAVFKWWSYGNVDFSEMIRLQPFPLQPVGKTEALFIAPEQNHPLILHYKIFDQLCFAWTTGL